MSENIEIKTPRSEAAGELFLSGHTCAQSVLAAFSDLTGVPADASLKLGSALGGGLCGVRTGQPCGAVLGMLAALGAIRGYETPTVEEKTALYAAGRELMKKFEEEFGATDCAELLRDFTVGENPSERTPEYYKTRPCGKFIRGAARLLEEYLGNEK
ncbi:MAG: C-GCAxxG-C-C family protein [Clostridia bacterium]|nr:C-GCAxxG-C-C family protein [Clostridia bacterium]